jgi:hypothetical protein
MKGERRFTAATAERIRVLLGRTRNAPRHEQKVLRQAIRNLGFFITDFDRSGSGFRPEDFDGLVRSGQIEVV